MAHTIILGAGLTGISTAYHFDQLGFSNYLVFEKESTIGGLCRSVHQDGFTFDYTGHLLHISDPYFAQLIETTVGFESLNQIKRRSFIYTHGTYTRYPFQTNLFGLPPEVVADCIIGYVERTTGGTEPHNFIQWVQHNFGKGLATHFFLPYQKKIFAYDLRKITASWTGRFVPSTSLRTMITGALIDNQDDVGYNAQFYYPKHGGIISWVAALAQRIKNPVHTGYTVRTIDLSKKLIYFTNGHCQPYQTLISTLPLDIFLSLIVDKPTTNLHAQHSYLKCNKVVNFNLGIKNPNLSDKHWIYFPESTYPFYRIGFPHNFSSHVVPSGCSSLYGEFSYIKKPASWIQAMLNKSIATTKELFDITDADIATQQVNYISHAYVIFDQWRDTNLPGLLNQLNLNNIYSIGRYGGWKYSSMQEAVLEGKAIAQQLTFMPARSSILKKNDLQKTRASINAIIQPTHKETTP